MKKKIIVWDYIGIAKKWIEIYVNAERVEVLQVVTREDSVAEIPDAWDFLFIFGEQNIFEKIVDELELPVERVVYALNAQSWKEHPEVKEFLLFYDNEAWRLLEFVHLRQVEDFVTCTVDGVSYVATSLDTTIMSWMYVHRWNWAKAEMDLFFRLSRQYYGLDGREGWFLDLGANIGTTGLYFKKNLDPNVKLLAFEPDSMNCRMLMVNILLNRMEEEAVVERMGLGAEKGECAIHKNASNPGGNSLVVDHGGETETVHVVPLDDYFMEKGLRFADVKYIWIDTEGFELQVLYGARNLLRDHAIPVFLEYNPHVWMQAGMLDESLDLLSSLYSGYIQVSEALAGHPRIHPTAELHAIKENPFVFGTGGDIFLVK